MKNKILAIIFAALAAVLVSAPLVMAQPVTPVGNGSSNTTFNGAGSPIFCFSSSSTSPCLSPPLGPVISQAAWYYSGGSVKLFAAGADRLAVSHATGDITVSPGSGGMAIIGTSALALASSTGRITWTTAGRYIDMNEVSGNMQLNSMGLNIVSANNDLRLANVMLVRTTAPTISSGFGTSPSVATSNGTAAFTINVGTGGAATSGVIGLPTASNGWNCNCQDITTPGANMTRQTASSTTSCTVTNVAMSTGAAAAWTASDILSCTAFAR